MNGLTAITKFGRYRLFHPLTGEYWKGAGDRIGRSITTASLASIVRITSSDATGGSSNVRTISRISISFGNGSSILEMDKTQIGHNLRSTSVSVIGAHSHGHRNGRKVISLLHSWSRVPFAQHLPPGNMHGPVLVPIVMNSSIPSGSSPHG